jgi:hypothetical protein
MKTYRVIDRILLNNAAAEENNIPNRWLHVGELLDFHDPIAKQLLINGDIELYVPPKPAPAPKKKPKPAPKTEEAK